MAKDELLQIKRLAALLGAKISVKTKAGDVISGKLVKAPIIDKQYFLYIDQGKSGGGEIFVNFSDVSTFSVSNIPKQKKVDANEHLPCKGKRDIENCKFSMQQFERLCQSCPNRMNIFKSPDKMK